MTENNSFLIWGSRPVIRSPLTDILMQLEDKDAVPDVTSPEVVARQQRSGSMVNEVQDGEGFDGGGKNVQISVDVDTPNLPGSSGHIDSCRATPERRSSRNPSTEDVARNSPKTESNGSINRSNPKVDGLESARSSESVGQSNPKLNELQKNLSVLNLLDMPHVLVPCSDANRYLSQLNDLVCEAVDTSRNKGGAVKHRESLSVQTKSLKRGASLSSCDFVNPEGVIIKPTAINLVGSSGVLASLSSQGLRNVKLKGISCFSNNAVVLVQAQELLEVSSPAVGGRRGEKLSEHEKRTHGSK